MRTFATVILVLLGLAARALAQEPSLTAGEVRRVDRDANKVTIRHEPLTKYDMPAMTMVFQVTDPGLLENLRPGDKVLFDVERKGGAFTLTRIEPAR